MISEEEINEVCKKALESWGTNFQEDMMIEESSELITELSKLVKAILKTRRTHLNDVTMDLLLANIIIELVDVRLMLKQMEILFLQDDASKNLYENTLKIKVNRLKEKLR